MMGNITINQTLRIGQPEQEGWYLFYPKGDECRFIEVVVSRVFAGHPEKVAELKKAYGESVEEKDGLTYFKVLLAVFNGLTHIGKMPPGEWAGPFNIPKLKPLGHGHHHRDCEVETVGRGFGADNWKCAEECETQLQCVDCQNNIPRFQDYMFVEKQGDAIKKTSPLCFDCYSTRERVAGRNVGLKSKFGN